MQEAINRYSREKEQYQEVADDVANELRFQAALSGVPCTVSGRAKDIFSFASKARRKNYTDPWNEITDKAGVRVVVDHCGNIDKIIQVVEDKFEVKRIEDERSADSEEDKLKYPKVHLQVYESKNTDELSQRRECELQIRSEAQNLWSRMSHAWMYKPSVRLPQNVRRSLYRLLVLVELYDSEVAQAIGGYLSRKDKAQNRLFIQLEQIYQYFSKSSYDPDTSEEYWPIILEAINIPFEDYIERIKVFTTEHKEKLGFIYGERSPVVIRSDINYPQIVTQPESLVIFEMLENEKWRFFHIWTEYFDEEALLEMADMWGVSFE